MSPRAPYRRRVSSCTVCQGRVPLTDLITILRDLITYATARCHEAGENPRQSPVIQAATALVQGLDR
jgi:hypothetical protein